LDSLGLSAAVVYVLSAKFTPQADISVTHLEAAWDFKDFEDIKSLHRLFG
jgi:glycosyltransferase A (GT-A) superfamily protein (DUF2064 family)